MKSQLLMHLSFVDIMLQYFQQLPGAPSGIKGLREQFLMVTLVPTKILNDFRNGIEESWESGWQWSDNREEYEL